jgi:hypothetical protein
MTGSDACLSPSYRFGQGLLVSIAFFVIGVGALFSKYVSRPVEQSRSTSSSSYDSSTDANDESDLVESIDRSSNSPMVERWVAVCVG